MELPRACYGLFAHCFIQDDTKYDFNPIHNESQNPCTKFQDVFRVLMYADNIIREAVGTIFFSIMRFVTHTHTRTHTQMCAHTHTHTHKCTHTQTHTETVTDKTDYIAR